MDKVAISLFSVVIGWFLAQGTTLVKDWWASRKLKAGLLTELQDIENQLQRILLIHGRQIQISALKGMEPTAALPVQNMFFIHYFKEAFSHLNREQRISYQLIHSSLEYLNKQNEELVEFAEEVYKAIRLTPDDKKTPPSIEAWTDRVIALYKTTRDLQWHITYHLRNPNSPAYDIMGPIHESYVKFEQEVDQEVKDIIEKAKSLSREDFEKIYDEKTFARSM